MSSTSPDQHPGRAGPVNPPETAPAKPIPPAAQRALAEAEARRAAIDARAAEIAARPEHQGRGGLEPVRYQDWEIKGLTVDF